MECQTVERPGRLEKHWEHMGSERVGAWVWVVERVGSECKHAGLEHEHVGPASQTEHVGSLMREGAGGTQCLRIQQWNYRHVTYDDNQAAYGQWF